MRRIADRGAIAAAYVGIGMAVTIVASFTLIIPIEGLIWLFALPSGLLIGYYANQRSNRRAGPWRRILTNGLFASVVTGLSMVALLLLLKVLFFYGDNGYRDPGLGGTLACSTGADCVYQRYLDADRGPDLVAAGVTDASSFTAFYWGEQLSNAGTVLGLTLLGGLGGAGMYGLTRPKAVPPESATAAR
ncbi:MAG: hypothetical protein HY262_08035 [Chloroflexi bacterium]|nr:hypothetical protein [Chloroflexota bacterium]